MRKPSFTEEIIEAMKQLPVEETNYSIKEIEDYYFKEGTPYGKNQDIQTEV